MMVMEFSMKDLMEAIGPSASLIFASWLFLSFLQTRYNSAYDRYRALIQERRERLRTADDQAPEDADRHQRSVKEQIALYRRRCEQMRHATNIGVLAAILLIVTILCSGLQVVAPQLGMLRYVAAAGALLGLGLLVLAAAFVIAENVLIRHAMNDEAADLPESRESQSPGAWRVAPREPGHASDGARTH
jgi:hypothetical protein